MSAFKSKFHSLLSVLRPAVWLKKKPIFSIRDRNKRGLFGRIFIDYGALSGAIIGAAGTGYTGYLAWKGVSEQINYQRQSNNVAEILFLQGDRDRLYSKLRLIQKVHSTLNVMKDKDDAYNARFLYSSHRDGLTAEDINHVVSGLDESNKQELAKGAIDKFGFEVLEKLDLCDAALKTYDKYKNKQRKTLLDQSYLLATDMEVRQLVMEYLHALDPLSRSYAVGIENGQLDISRLNVLTVKSMRIGKLMDKLPEAMFEKNAIKCIDGTEDYIKSVTSAKSLAFKDLEAIELKMKNLRKQYGD